MKIPSSKLGRNQQGAALLLMMLVVIVGAASILVTQLNRNAGLVLQSSATQRSLAQAKEALLAYAMSYPDLYGGSSVLLPCPDLNAGGGLQDGESHSANCGANGETVLGRLPWRTLGIAAPIDGSSECIWYAVSGEYKNALSATSAMVNPDSNGQIELYQSESGVLIEGQFPAERPVALLISAGPPQSYQIRQARMQLDQQCSDDFSAASFLDTDAVSGISNGVLLGSVGIDQFVRAAGVVDGMNDRIATIGRGELADLVYDRHDFDSNIRVLTRLIAECVASYGRSNPGGATDLRLPWPAPVTMADYRLDSQYDDVVGGVLSGRLADTVADSNAETGNSATQVISACDPIAVPGWSAAQVALWRQWKDHFFYYVAESFAPVSTVPNTCSNCISVNGSGQYAGIVIFANRRLEVLSQVRDAPPIDPDTRDDILNYLEMSNGSLHPFTSGIADLESRPPDDMFNDILYCIDSALAVTSC